MVRRRLTTQRFTGASVGVVVGSLVLAGCGGDPVTDTSEDVAFTPCTQVECSGTLPSGAEYDILLPDTWNGTLAVFSGGLNSAGNRDPQSDETSPEPTPTSGTTDVRPTGPELAPLWSQGDQGIADAMLQAGYAIAGAAPQMSGWAVGSQVTAVRELHEYFVNTIARPNRTYLWGQGTGALASARTAETDPEWVSGVLAFCAPMSGPIQSFNLALDVAFTLRQLLDPTLQLTGFSSLAQARAERDRAADLVRRAATGTRTQRAHVVFTAAIGLLPNRSRTQTGATLASQLKANAEAIVNLLDQATVQRFRLEQQVGGNPSGNVGTNYAPRISEAQTAQIDSLVPGITDQMLAVVAGAPRVTADDDAMAAARDQGELSGELAVPVLTVHNAADPVYIAPNQSWYRERVTDHDAQANLVTAFVLPPAGTYDEAMPAAEGVGNCNFEPRTLLGGLIQLNRWVRVGEYPGRDSVAEVFRGQRVTLDYQPGPWPQMSGVPLAPSATPAAAG